MPTTSGRTTSSTSTRSASTAATTKAPARRPTSTRPTGGSQPGDPRKTRQWVKLRDQVVAEEPECRLRLPGCTITSTTADHIQPFKTHPQLALVRSNLRGACETCNKKRGTKADEQAADRPRQAPARARHLRPAAEPLTPAKN
ncbi:HNH endonuclease [Nocardioides sp. W3-2-3]|uniref:HNH endonuclease n=1 Tax=Nocardioides convexus TaxID=2712224 RepID=UPI00241891A2|nr:HNH endonuclease [Nocardioides convexus]NGZ99410.1 HNH endonuclease [Nocardioides convexus]